MLGLLLLMVVSFGCISLHVNYDQRFYGDGSSDLQINLEVPSDSKYLGDLSCDDLELEDGFECNLENGNYVISGNVHFNSSDEAGFYDWEVKEDLFSREYILRVTSYPSVDTDPKYERELKFRKLSGMEYGIYKDADITLNYTATLPGTIEYTNGNQLSSNKVNWDLVEYLYSSGDKPLEARSKEYKWINIGIVTLLILGSLGVIFFKFTTRDVESSE